MKRSEINVILRAALDFLAQHSFKLPPFADWTLEQWRTKGPECGEIAAHQLGWDITDFGSGDFAACGLFLFTLRNGSSAATGDAAHKTYAEKIMIVRENQLTPTHFHYQKMEDIINRGGGNLCLRLWNASTAHTCATTPVTVSCDGVRTTVAAGATITLPPGASITLPPRNYHCFWGEAGHGSVLVGEVSRVNDDHTDNHFLQPVGRFPCITEDEPPLRLLVGDYAKYYRYT